MLSTEQSASRQAGGLNALKNNPTRAGCNNPKRPYLKATDNDKKIVYFIRPDCKLWSCEACAVQRQLLWVFIANYGGDYLLAEGRNLSFVTLTSHEANRSLVGGIRVWRDAWKKLSARWRRRAPGAQYFYIGEHKKTLHFHIHMVTSAEIKTRWYKDNARALGLGYEAKAIEITHALECGGYMGKYLGKAISEKGWPRYWRRVNCSRKWPRPIAGDPALRWLYLGNNDAVVRASMMGYARAGWTIDTALDIPGIRQS